MLPNSLTRSVALGHPAGQIWWLSTPVPQFHSSATVGWKFVRRCACVCAHARIRSRTRATDVLGSDPREKWGRTRSAAARAARPSSTSKSSERTNLRCEWLVGSSAAALSVAQGTDEEVLPDPRTESLKISFDMIRHESKPVHHHVELSSPKASPTETGSRTSPCSMVTSKGNGRS